MNNLKNKFLWPFHYFRAFAIVNILIIHVWKLPPNSTSKQSTVFVDLIRESIFHSSSIYFMFISGFLFHYLTNKLQISKFFIGKFKNVLVPYIIINLTIIIGQSLLGSKINLDNLNFLFILETLVKGTASIQFWYIPFIVLIFLISPICFHLFNKKLPKYFPLIFLIPLLGTRTDIYITIGQYIYFFPIYLMGMYFSMNFSKLTVLISNYFKLLCVIALTSSLLLFYTVNKNLLFFDFFNLNESLFYLQKISITFIFIYLSRNITSNRFPYLNIIANCSFSIFFTHILFNTYLKRVYFFIDSYTIQFLKIPLSLIYVFCILLINVLFCMVVKKILGKRSKYFIGY